MYILHCPCRTCTYDLCSTDLVEHVHMTYAPLYLQNMYICLCSTVLPEDVVAHLRIKQQLYCLLTKRLDDARTVLYIIIILHTVYVCVCLCVCMCLSARVCACVCVYVCVSLCGCVRVSSLTRFLALLALYELYVTVQWFVI